MQKNIDGKLLAIVIGDSAPVALYVRNQRRSSEKAGIEFEERSFAGESTGDEVLAACGKIISTARHQPPKLRRV